MTGINRRRADCQCGGLVGLFFDTIVIEDYSAGDLHRERHYARGTFTRARQCQFFVNSIEITGDRLDQYLVNSARSSARAGEHEEGCAFFNGGVGWYCAACVIPAERPTQDPMRAVSTPRPTGVAAGRAAETMERYAAMPDNP